MTAKSRVSNFVDGVLAGEVEPQKAPLPRGTVVGPDGVRVNAKTGKPVRAYRGRSLRGYRRQLDEVIEALRQGKISSNRAKAMTVAIQAASEAYLAERRLQIAGILDVEDEAHPLGDDGGAEIGGSFGPEQIHKVRRKTGVAPDGNPIDETEVSVEGGPEVTQGLPLLSGPGDDL